MSGTHNLEPGVAHREEHVPQSARSVDHPLLETVYVQGHVRLGSVLLDRQHQGADDGVLCHRVHGEVLRLEPAVLCRLQDN